MPLTTPQKMNLGVKRVGDLEAFEASIRHEGRTVTVGLYGTEATAIRAREYAMRKISGADNIPGSMEFKDVDIIL